MVELPNKKGSDSIIMEQLSYMKTREGDDEIRIDDFFEATPNQILSRSLKKTQNSYAKILTKKESV